MSSIPLRGDRKEQQADQGERTGRIGNGAVVYPGAHPVIDYKQKKTIQLDSKFIIAHFGSLGGVRHLGPFIEGLEAAIEQNSAMLEQISIHLYGSIGDDDRRRVADCMHSVFVLEGVLPRREALAAMRRCDLLLLIQGRHQISAETIPSKLYEYLHVGRPVLALAHENHEIRELIEPLGHTCVSSEPDEIARALTSLYSRWKTGAVAEILPSPYTVQDAVERMLAL
ncbi:MAG: hypothetical protein D3924_01735 [Candidatus Electrothrix sp. AR4]|nr:hypothetical protein [Candidatus Electrothrix sp. AR4]